MRHKSILILCWVAAMSFIPIANAVGFDVQVEQFFQQQYAKQNGMQVNVRVLTPEAQWPQCATPQLTLPSNGRTWGRISLSVRCGDSRSFIQTEVQVSGTYWVAARAIRNGTTLTAADLQQQTGRLDTLPARTLLDSKQGIGAVSLKNIDAGQPIALNMLRRAWVVRAGQEVQVRASGGGFNVSSLGKAMGNASPTETVRVRMASGQIISGVVEEDGSIRLPQ